MGHAALLDKVEALRAGKSADFPPEASTLAYALSLDAQDDLSHLRDEFILPTRGSVKKKALDGRIPGQSRERKSEQGGQSAQSEDEDTPAIYFVGNSLGAQPKKVREHINAQLEYWASIGVNGHFTDLGNSPIVNWQDMAELCAKKSTDLVGASADEIVVMNSLTMNLHAMMASFYRPTAKRRKIILEWKPFPSDWYAIQSQVEWHGLDAAECMVEIQPDDKLYVSTETILATIDEHADETALFLFPGIQYYSGQLFDMARITAYAQARGIMVGWDLAHAVGNVELALHEWNVDFAVWCTYKYVNAGPGAIAGAFVHERHGKVDYDKVDDGKGDHGRVGKPAFRPRLSGWYGGDRKYRFDMDKTFRPTPGAAGYQCSNPSALDLAALSAALSVFNMTSMAALRSKALVLTAYAEWWLDRMLAEQDAADEPLFRIITPRKALERGTQLSLQLRPGLMDRLIVALEENAVLCDKRKPDVIRLAPVPMYTSFEDVWRFMQVFQAAVRVG